MTLRTDIAANYAGAFTAAAAPIIAVPFYLSALGTARWGLISFAAALSSLFAIFEVGISQRLVRDLTIAFDSDPRKTAAAFRGVVVYYWVLSGILALVLLASRGFLVTHWLRLEAGQLHDGNATVLFAGFLVLTQVPNSAYRSALLSSDRHLSLNVQIASFATLKHLAGVAIAWRFRELPFVYASYAVTGTIELIVRGWTANRALKRHGVGERIGWAQSRKMLLAGLKLSVAVVAGLITMQSGRLFLSHFSSLQELGIYGIAASLGFGVLQLVYPLQTAITPLFALAVDDRRKFRVLCFRLLLVVVAGLILATASYLLIGDTLVRFWLHSPGTFKQVRPVLRLILVGTALNVLYQVGYLRWLVMGRTRPILLVNVASLVLAVAITPELIQVWGAIGAAGSWVMINSVGVVANLRWMLGHG